MKAKQYQLSCLKKQLREKKERRIKVLVWKLTEEQKDYIENVLHYRVEPYLYRIPTRTFKNINQIKYSIIKDLHYMNKRGKKFEVRKLSNDDKKVLDMFGVSYKYVVKYKIYLF